MNEIYTMGIKNGRLEFTAGGTLPDWALKSSFAPPSSGYQLVTRMGDPDLIHCAVIKTESCGGFFVFYDKKGFLFAAIAKDNLVYSLAMGFFGELAANARYGADVFENMELPDD